jgi:hypothetical protein
VNIKYKKGMNTFEQITTQLVAASDDSISACVIKAAQIIKECAEIKLVPVQWKKIENSSHVILHFSQGGRFKIEEHELHKDSPIMKRFILWDLHNLKNLSLPFESLEEAKEFAEFLRSR